MKGSPRLLVILTACAGLLLELLILVVMLLPTSGPGADAAVSKSAFIVQASVLAIVASLAAAIIALAGRATLERRVFLLGLTPGSVALLAVATSVVIHLRDPRLSSSRHNLEVEIRRSAVHSEAVQVLSIRVVDDLGYSGSGLPDADGRLEDGVINERFRIQGGGDRTLEVELESRICVFDVPSADRFESSPRTGWRTPRTVWRKLPSGRTAPAETGDCPVEARLSFPTNLDANARS